MMFNFPFEVDFRLSGETLSFLSVIIWLGVFSLLYGLLRWLGSSKVSVYAGLSDKRRV